MLPLTNNEPVIVNPDMNTLATAAAYEADVAEFAVRVVAANDEDKAAEAL